MALGTIGWNWSDPLGGITTTPCRRGVVILQLIRQRIHRSARSRSGNHAAATSQNGRLRKGISGSPPSLSIIDTTAGWAWSDECRSATCAAAVQVRQLAAQLKLAGDSGTGRPGWLRLPIESRRQGWGLRDHSRSVGRSTTSRRTVRCAVIAYDRTE